MEAVVTFRREEYLSLEAQWLAARKYMASDPRRPLDRIGPR